MLQALLAAGADPNGKDNHQETPLGMAAIGNEDAAAIQTLIAAGADPNAWTDIHWYGDITRGKPLHAAIKYNENAAVSEALIAGGADPNARNSAGQSPLHLARNATKARLLLGAGANCKARDESGLTPLHTAVMSCCDEQLIGVLIDAGSHPKARDASGRTPLHQFALSVNRLYGDASEEIAGAIVKPLIARGADLNAIDQNGNTPLHLAAASRNWGAEIAITILLDAGANATLKNAQDQTPWDLARGDERLKQTDAYWRLNDARFEAPAEVP